MADTPIELGVDLWAEIDAYNEEFGPPIETEEKEAFWGAFSGPLFDSFGVPKIILVNLGIVTDDQEFNPANKLTKMTLAADITITLTLPAKPAKGYLRLQQDIIGLRNVVFVNTKTAGGGPINIASLANRVTILEFLYDTDAWVLTDLVSNVL